MTRTWVEGPEALPSGVMDSQQHHRRQRGENSLCLSSRDSRHRDSISVLGTWFGTNDDKCGNSNSNDGSEFLSPKDYTSAPSENLFYIATRLSKVY